MNNTIWQLPEIQVSLSDHELHIWKSSLNVDGQRFQFLKSLLSCDEQSRAERFYFVKDKNQFIVGRGVLRVLLGNYLDTDPQKVKFYYNEFGKPFLENQFSKNNLKFNLSHSKDMLVMAFAKNVDVGIDIEYVRSDIDVLRLARHFFSQREVSELLSISSYLMNDAFFNCWTRKEAFIKAKGQGLSIPLDKFDVSLSPGEPAKLIRLHDNPNEIAEWYLQELSNIGEGYISSIAIKGKPNRIYNWEYDGKFELIYRYSAQFCRTNSYIFN